MTTVSFAPETEDEQTAHVKKLIAVGGAAIALLAQQLADDTITKSQFIARATATIAPKAQAAAGIGVDVHGHGGHLDTEDIDQRIADWSDNVDDFADTVGEGGHSTKQLAAWSLGLAGIIWQTYHAGKIDGAQGAAADKAEADAAVRLRGGTKAEDAADEEDGSGSGSRAAAAEDIAAAREQAAAETLFDWILDPDIEASAHCDDCKAFADGSPYSEDDLPAHPGDGTSECGPSCRCDLKRTDGDPTEHDADFAGPAVWMSATYRGEPWETLELDNASKYATLLVETGAVSFSGSAR